MTWQQTLVIVWIQFAVAGVVLLLLARIALFWLNEPVDRIRAILAALVVATIIPLWLLWTPLPTWRLEMLAATEKPTASATRPGELDSSPNSLGTPADLQPAAMPLNRQAPTVETGPSRSIDRSVALNPSKQQQPTGWTVGPWTIAVLSIGIAHTLAAFYFVAERVIGMLRLRRLLRSTTPAPASVISVYHDVSAGRRGDVRILLSRAIHTPLTFGWWQPVIVLPEELSDTNSPTLRFCLSHEYSHIERNDVLAWQVVWLCQFALWFHPLFWILRRELQLCQDLLADSRSTGSQADAVEYSALLVSLARKQRERVLMGALTLFDRPGQLTRRVKVLLERQAPLRARCTWNFSLVLSLVVMSGTILSTSVRLAADVPQDKPAAASDRPADNREETGKTITYQGVVADKVTGTGIAKANVVVRRLRGSWETESLIEETRHVTGPDGTYSFQLSPSQLAEKSLHLEINVDHGRYVTRNKVGNETGTFQSILTKKQSGVRPFFERIEIQAAEPATGRVLLPDGTPASGIKVRYISFKLPEHFSAIRETSLVETETGPDGRYRMNLRTEGDGFCWILPTDQAIVETYIGKQRGDLGDIRLEPGMRVGGRIVSRDDKPLANVLVSINITAPNKFVGFPVAPAVSREAISDKDGHFRFDPLPPGQYRLNPRATADASSRNRSRLPLPGAFIAQDISLLPGSDLLDLQLKALDDIQFTAQFMNSKGERTKGDGIMINAQFEGKPWGAFVKSDSEGKVSIKMPRGVRGINLVATSSTDDMVRYRRAADEPLENGFIRDYGPLNSDVNDFQVVLYRRPTVLVKAVDEQGQPIKSFEVVAQVAPFDSPIGQQRFSGFELQSDGRYRGSVFPDETVQITVSATGYDSVTETLQVPEGETRELEIKLYD